MNQDVQTRADYLGQLISKARQEAGFSVEECSSAFELSNSHYGAIENDERIYGVNDCLQIHRDTNLPLVFDVFHFHCYNHGEDLKDVFSEVCRTWSSTDGLPITDYSSQEKTKRKGSHAQTINLKNFRNFIDKTKGMDFDIMREIKDKEKSALKALKILNTIR